MSLTIRPAVAEDRPAIVHLWLAAWNAAMPEIDFAARVPWFEARLDQMDQERIEILVATDRAEILGFVTVDPASGYLDQLATDIRVQRRGVGRGLLRAAKERSPAGLTLKVNQSNHQAIRLYRVEGFVVIGESISMTSGLPLYDMHWPGGGDPAKSITP